MSEEVLYLSYDGMTDPIGQSQVIPYVAGLAKRGHRMTLISNEKSESFARREGEVRALLDAAGVHWIPQTYHRGSVARTLPLHVGQALSAALRRYRLGGHRCRLVHARSYVPATVGSILRKMIDVPLLFDMRGFWVDEKVETGVWSAGRLYRLGKRVEGPLFGHADAVVSLTESGKRELLSWPSVGGRGVPVSVIPTCVDVDTFDVKRVPGPLTVGYVGSLGARYLTDELVDLFAHLRRLRPEAKLYAITNSDSGELLRAAEKYGVRDALEMESVRHDEVPSRLARMDVTFCFVKAGFASLASCPTKFGESLAAGCPVVVNRGIGDCADIVERERVGIATDLVRGQFPALAAEIAALLDEGSALRARCKRVSRERFELSRAVDEYERIYGHLERLRRVA